MSRVTLLLLPPECEVCGQEVHLKFLKAWNDKQVCHYCIHEINEEAEKYASTNHN